MKPMTKEKSSRLDPFEDTLFAMAAAKKTLVEMKQWLSARGVTISFQAISLFLISRRERRRQAETLRQIAAGLEPVAQAHAAFQTDPEPDLDTLIKLSRIIVFEHTIKLAAPPGPDRPSPKITNLILRYLAHQNKWETRKREIDLAERMRVARHPATPTPAPIHTISSDLNVYKPPK
jgi:hypothetical protein